MREYLLERGAGTVTVVSHPLAKEGDTRHRIATYTHGGSPRERRLRLPFHPPLTYPLDLFVPLWPQAVDCWFGFNSLAAARGIAARSIRRADTVVYWCVDFVPDRFGSRTVVTRAYDALDRLCCRRSDARFELSEAARDGRDARHRISTHERAPTTIVPMGAWLDRVPTVPEDGFERRQIVFLGHLVPRQGVGVIVDACALLSRSETPVTAEIIGRGPLEQELRQRAERQGIADRVRFRGFVADERQVERLLAEASLAMAPYEPDPDSFSRFADPGKLKAYLAAGLPTLLTDVPPNARDVANHGGAELVEHSAEAFAAAIARLLSAPEEWRRRREAALAYAREYDWPAILGPALRSVGLSS